MGLFDSFRKSEILSENKDNKKIIQLKNMSNTEEITQFINKYNKTDVALYCDKDLFWDNAINICERGINIDVGNYICKELYNTIVTNKNNENQIRIYNQFKDIFLSKDLLEEINYKELLNDFNDIYTIFNDKSSALRLLKILYDHNDSKGFIYDTKLRFKIKSFAIKTRQYFSDEGAYIASLYDTLNQIKLNAYNMETANNILDKAEITARQLAGFVIYDEESLAKLPTKVDDFLKDLNIRYNNLVSTFAEKESSLNVQIDEAEREFKKRVSGITGEADETVAKVEAARNEAVKQLNGLNKQIVSTINNFLGLHPEGEDVLRALDTGYIELLDTNLDAERRYIKAIQLKNPKEYYVGAFDEALKLAIINQPILLQGPSGCGKSTIAKQICETLGLKFINFGFIVDEFSGIKGYMDANNNYVKTSFYDCYKYGGGFFIDEIDMSKPEALLDLNKITGTNGYEPYTFPNGETVKPHPNFRLFAAANTFGEGGNVLYKRNALDASTLDRFSIVKVNYNEELEKWIMKDYIDEYEFLVTMREVLKDSNSNKLVTTKTMADIKKCLDSRIIPLEDALATKLIKGENPETLESICNGVEERICNNYTVKTFEKAIQKDKIKRK